MKRKTVSSLKTDTSSAVGQSSLPTCSHGVALRFTRKDTKTGIGRDFYACSANRDRKVCPLFFWVDDWERKLRLKPDAVRSSTAITSDNSKKAKTFDKVLGLEAYTDNAANAQYLFDKVSIDRMVKILKSHLEHSCSHPVLCIGTPSIHRALLCENIDSFLLDDDERLAKILPKTIRFNMFNGEMYGNTLPIETLFSAVIADPPFHPELLPALFNTIASSFSLSEDCLTLLAFPYFNASQITQAAPHMHMSDVRLTYRNHAKYKTADRSPVRLFSSRKIGSIVTELKDYGMCVKCEDLKHVSNAHCDACNQCTSISGKHAFIHCKKCNTCVKPTAKHCDECNRCFLSPHPHGRSDTDS